MATGFRTILAIIGRTDSQVLPYEQDVAGSKPASGIEGEPESLLARAPLLLPGVAEDAFARGARRLGDNEPSQAAEDLVLDLFRDLSRVPKLV